MCVKEGMHALARIAEHGDNGMCVRVSTAGDAREMFALEAYNDCYL